MDTADQRGGRRPLVRSRTLLSDFSIKNLTLVAAAAGVIGQADLENRDLAVAVGIFVVICTMASWSRWSSASSVTSGAIDSSRSGGVAERNVAAITAVVMVLLGTSLIGQGIGGLMA